MKSLIISEETHTELTKMKGELMAETGKPNLTYDEVLMELIKRSKKAFKMLPQIESEVKDCRKILRGEKVEDSH